MKPDERPDMYARPKNSTHERERARRETVAEREWIIRNDKRLGAADLVLPALALAVLVLI
ncbi:MAG: hypothetical protein R3D45_00710 [Rhizobiaceae bacterium]